MKNQLINHWIFATIILKHYRIVTFEKLLLNNEVMEKVRFQIPTERSYIYLSLNIVSIDILTVLSVCAFHISDAFFETSTKAIPGFSVKIFCLFSLKNNM